MAKRGFTSTVLPSRAISGGGRAPASGYRDPRHAHRVGYNDAVQRLGEQDPATRDSDQDLQRLATRIDQHDPGECGGTLPGAARGTLEVRHEADAERGTGLYRYSEL